MTPLSLTVGQKYDLGKATYIMLSSTPIEINSILPLCMTKFDLDTQDDTFKITAFGNCIIDQVIYDLDNYVDANGTLIVRPTRDFIFKFYSQNIDPGRVTTGLEAIDDLQMDLILKVADVLIANGSLTLTANEQTNYDKLKSQWKDVTSVTLETATYEIDYAIENGVNGNPGLKAVARKDSADYKNALASFNYQF